MTPDRYREEYIIPCYFLSLGYRLRPSSFFDIAQELAVRGSTQLGVPDPVLLERGLCWILVRNAAHFDRLPGVEEKVSLETWHSGVRGPMSTRDYRITDASGKVIIKATSSWALMDVKARSLAKPERIFDLMSAEPQNPERALQPDAPKIVFPRDCAAEEAGTHLVSYSDLDYNLHANNAKYPHWAMDCLPAEVVTRQTVTDFYINYNREARMGEAVRLMRARGADGAWYVEGLVDGLQSFICKIVFA